MRSCHYLERLATKADIINWLGWQRGYRSYLEIGTPHTGFMFGRISPRVFPEISRVLYDCADDYGDGLTITGRERTLDSSRALTALREAGRTFDVVFLDAHHTMEASRRDLALGLSLLAPGGILVAHDCYPRWPEVVSPEYQEGSWMGVTYLAFLDLVKERPDLVHNVVDLDVGCGLLYLRGSLKQRAGIEETDSPRDALLSFDYHDWNTFQTHAPSLLNLLSAAEFMRRYRTRPLSLAARGVSIVLPVLRAARVRAALSVARRFGSALSSSR